MYNKGYGIIETQAPLHVGASAGEETGNLNLIFRDQFTQTGIVPGSSIRGRFRADMRRATDGAEQVWYGHEAVAGQTDGGTTEAKVKFEYASVVWLPVFCPGQPVVWVSCPRLLSRYKAIMGIEAKVPAPYTAPASLTGRDTQDNKKVLFFNLGFLEIQENADLSAWVPEHSQIQKDNVVVVADSDIGMIHDMALYRQSRVKLADDEKKVDGGAFFNVEALPEGTVMIFPVALKPTENSWEPFGEGESTAPMYFGGLESIGFGRCTVQLSV
ncbi:MAG: RAMP superfamily CRISPR-associated protein [Cyanobacteria bacterium J06555_13]